MRLVKDNIVIRSANIDDASQLHKWWNDGTVMEHAGFPYGICQPLEKTKAHILSSVGSRMHLCIIEIDGVAVGELNYKLSDHGEAYPGWKICEASFQNKGYGPKIIRMLFQYLFTDKKLNNECRIERIVWDTMLENKRAQYVYETKIGARKTKVVERAWKDQLGVWRTAVYYEMTRNDFLRNI